MWWEIARQFALKRKETFAHGNRLFSSFAKVSRNIASGQHEGKTSNLKTREEYFKERRISFGRKSFSINGLQFWHGKMVRSNTLTVSDLPINILRRKRMRSYTYILFFTEYKSR
uniref:Type III restriction-modification system Bce10987IP enzyme res n=1 Tax=Anthurium amnicola TaxID=1678845 RepID=A0A1D1YNX2_9ARAE